MASSQLSFIRLHSEHADFSQSWRRRFCHDSLVILPALEFAGLSVELFMQQWIYGSQNSQLQQLDHDVLNVFTIFASYRRVHFPYHYPNPLYDLSITLTLPPSHYITPKYITLILPLNHYITPKYITLILPLNS